MITALFYYILVGVAFFTVGVMLILRRGGSTVTRLMRIAALLVVPVVFFLWFACILLKVTYGNSMDPVVVQMRLALRNESLPDEKIVSAFVDGDLRQTEYELKQLNRR